MRGLTTWGPHAAPWLQQGNVLMSDCAYIEHVDLDATTSSVSPIVTVAVAWTHHLHRLLVSSMSSQGTCARPSHGQEMGLSVPLPWPRSALPSREQAGVSNHFHNLQSNFHYFTLSLARGRLTSFAYNAFGAVTLLNPALQIGTGCLGQARAVLCLHTWKHNVCLSVPVHREGRYREFRPGCQPAEQ